MNKVILTGNLTKDPELRKTPDDVSVVSCCVAVKRDIKNSQGEYDTDFINFVAWNKSADYLATYAKMGDRVELSGRWQVRKYDNDKGETKTVNEVVVEQISCFNKQPKEGTPAPQKTEEPEETVGWSIADEDLPF